MRPSSISCLCAAALAALLVACGGSGQPSGADPEAERGGASASARAGSSAEAAGESEVGGADRGGNGGDLPPGDAGALSMSSGGSAASGGIPDRMGECDVSAVFAKPDNGCTNASCHGKQFQGGVDLASPGFAERLAGARSTTQACGGQLLIDPANPDDSLLLRLVDAKRFAATPKQCGVMMPYGSSEGLTGDDLRCVESWVRDVAAAAVQTMPPVVPFEPLGAESYLAKVKLLLTGGAVTDDDLARMRADPQALTTLVEAWEATPAFQSKMADFFRIALQQKLIGTLNFQLDTVEGVHRAQLNANAEESFLRSAWDLVQSRQPFTRVLTTRRVAVTTGLLVALAYADNTATALRAAGNRHTLYRAPPAGTPPAPWSLAYQVQTKSWLLPQLAEGCPQLTLNGPDVYDMMMGLVRCPQPIGNVTLSTGTVLGDADFSDWHFVETLASSAEHPPTPFYDVEALRSASTVYLSTPRIGFFTTPAFLGNWDTNDGNKFRVTLSQTMITALGEPFSAADPTKPISVDGLDAAHANPDSSCFGCHQFLDPMRGYFSGKFATNYQASPTVLMYRPSLSFHGVTLDGGDLSSFAQALAGHPLFASAWVQKLCYYANSESCEASDPEVQRVAQVFADSGYDFLTLVKELFTSPLITGAAKTQSYTNQDLLVSITRRQHFCQLIDQRLGTKDTCKNAGSVVGLIPQDEFARGASVPVQPAITGLFHFAAAEKLCSTIATKLVGTTARFNPNTSATAVNDLVQLLMGLPPTHSRSLTANQQLTRHFNDARALGATATEAMRDTFTVACMSPDVMGVGL